MRGLGGNRGKCGGGIGIGGEGVVWSWNREGGDGVGVWMIGGRYGGFGGRGWEGI